MIIVSICCLSERIPFHVNISFENILYFCGRDIFILSQPQIVGQRTVTAIFATADYAKNDGDEVEPLCNAMYKESALKVNDILRITSL